MIEEWDLAGPTGRLALTSNALEENIAVKTYICGNPPYAGLSSQSTEQKEDLKYLFQNITNYWKSFDYVSGWLIKAKNYSLVSNTVFAFVMTNSICQGQQVPMIWPHILTNNLGIKFAYQSFKWTNLASKNAVVSVVIVGLAQKNRQKCKLFDVIDDNINERSVDNINAYLIPARDLFVIPLTKPVDGRPPMVWGNKPTDGGNLILNLTEAEEIKSRNNHASKFIKPYYGSAEFIDGASRFCIWVTDEEKSEADIIPAFKERFKKVEVFRRNSKSKETQPAAKFPHKFRQIQGSPGQKTLIIPIHSSENRGYLPVGLLPSGSIVSNAAYTVYDPPLWLIAIIASKLHLVWVASVCGKLETRYRYSNTLGWNTFPIPKLTEKNISDLNKTGANILLARESYYPAPISILYEPDNLLEKLANAHDSNDETLERIYIGRKFKNDTERLEKLFDLYSKMVDIQAGKSTKRNKNSKVTFYDQSHLTND